MRAVGQIISLAAFFVLWIYASGLTAFLNTLMIGFYLRTLSYGQWRQPLSQQ